MSAIRVLFSVFLVLWMVSCGESADAPASKHPAVTHAESQATPISSGWAPHLEFSPEGWVSAHDDLLIGFTHPVTAGEVNLNQPVLGIVAIEPRVNAQVVFDSEKTLRIRFEQPLDRDVEYALTLFPNKLQGIKNSLYPHQFKIKAYQQDFSVQIDGLAIDPKTHGHTINGKVTLNDRDRIQALEKILDAEQEGLELAITWNHLSEVEHEFTVSGIERRADASTATLRWDGSAIGVDRSGESTLPIPALNRFEVLGVNSRKQKDRYIAIQFSEPLDRGQSFMGLVRIDGQAPASMRVDGNVLRAYPSRPLSGDISIEVLEGIRSTRNARLLEPVIRTLTLLEEQPGVRFKDSTHILPSHSRVTIPIEAVNVDSVQITAYQLKAANLGQFLQSRNLSARYSDSSTTAALWRKTLQLPEIPRDQWTQFDLDVSDYLKDFGNDLLAFEVKIDKSHSILECETPRPQPEDALPPGNPWPFQETRNNPSWVQRYYHSQGRYQWTDRENPCKDYYYQHYNNPIKDFRYFHASDIGLIAKMAVDKSMLVVATDINSAQPLRDVEVVAYNRQHQPVARGKTDPQGMLKFSPVSAPLYLLASQNEDVGFLRLPRNESLSTNVFDTGGEQAGSGIKGFFYGERGVWRPGDEIFLTFIAHDRTGQLPENYPLTLDFFDPRGNKFDSITHTQPMNGFYSFRLRTDEDSPTGSWRAVIRYGGDYFSKVVPVETIKPNRLKIELTFPSDKLSAGDGPSIEAGLFSQWLNGATAAGLKADIDMNVRAVKTTVAGYDQYVFDDPTRELQSRQQKVFQGNLDENGKASFSLAPSINNAPGNVKLQFTTRVFEKSGNFSIQYASVAYQPYSRLVGLHIPQGRGWNRSISRDEQHQINMMLVDAEGNPIANSELDFQLYRIGWRWWWDSSSDSIASYISRNHADPLVEANLKTDEAGRSHWTLEGQDYPWGRYLMRVCDRQGDHCSGKVVYLGWSYQQQKNPSGETQLMLTTDKKRYAVGDTATLTIPQIVAGSDKGKILLTLESGTRILSQQWIEKDIEEGQYSIPVTADMAPNVYAHVTYVQAFADKNNDSPVRLYGITPILVDNPDGRLAPQLTLPEKVKPQSELKIVVAESRSKAMTYTLAVVDEGLLSITNYKTPDPYDTLYRREALGVLTWDMYDLLSNSSVFNTERLLTIGGSDAEDDTDALRKKRRFPPVVEFLGPFYLPAGEQARHVVKLPEYMGSVRVMLVAGDISEGVAAFGKTDGTVKVTQPLTLLATVPRVLGPEESLKLPVNVFVTDPDIKEVALSVDTDSLISATQAEKSLSFTRPGDQIISFDLSAAASVGTGSLLVKAKSGEHETSHEVSIPVRSPNLPQTVSERTAIKAGESQTLSLLPNGMPNTNYSYVEFSRVPSINLEHRLNSLIGYPHGCLEQTTSKLFPQIFLNRLLPLTDQQQTDIEFNIKEGLRKFTGYQSAGGEFSYWPGGHYSNHWANTYVGHFLLEARNVGYPVPASVIERWLKTQKRFARKVGNRDGYESTDAYLLYSLTLADAADFNAMNRLKEKLATLPATSANHRLARWLLAAAYARAGVLEASEELLSQADNQPLDYDWAGYTYGSKLRDTALLAITYKHMDKPKKAWDMAQQVAMQLSKPQYLSTQSQAWALIALSNYFDSDTKQQAHPFSWKINNQAEEKTELISPMLRRIIDSDENIHSDTPIKLEVKNEGEKPIYVLLGNRGTPANAEEKASSQGVRLSVSFVDMQGLPLDIGALRQGTDFKARVSVSAANPHSRLENLALSVITPSGWEIGNDRMAGIEPAKELEYQDIRDDRVLSYFTLGNYYWWQRQYRREITVDITLNATYAGRFYLPGWRVESMYDGGIRATTAGRWVQVLSSIP
ncbi:hypothetical protein HBA55_00745 [Pseudomaricurvus alkylphenolicus]|uniref:alpha-2-macroglobulin family protein n=1 Tax=Pseudomaricurvus alkylphenolicus TaxID=1306991 RepID=UPI001423972F|nr:MG2 domain-containing protein [Pseudomaricurvus alkylphenolicus]NIB38088.1 hypothetical protein [Pseudomaricurvus alkylphenolicus]